MSTTTTTRGPSLPARIWCAMTYKMRTVTVLVLAAVVLGYLHRWLMVAPVVLAGLAVLALVPSRRLPAHRVRHLRFRLRLRLHPGRGFATAFELHRHWGRRSAYRRSQSPHRSRVPDTHSVGVGRGHYRHCLRVPHEEHLLILAPPRTFKTALLADMILHYPGAVISTSTKHDVYGLTSGVRAQRGPVAVMNPQGIGNVWSTFRFNLVSGCLDPATAIRRADALAQAVSVKGTEDGSFWQSRAAACLRAMMYAAAIVGADMRTVTGWALDNGASLEAEKVLEDAGAHMWAKELKQLRGEAQKTADTIRMTLASALQFMVDPSLAQSVITDGDGLDIRQFIREGGSLYLITSSQGQESPLAPLFACIVNEFHYQAALMGSQQPGGRLDPPMGIFGDEIVQVAPIALPQILADSGGKGIQVVTVTHGHAQLRTRWGADGAQAILDTSGVLVFLPGITDPATLAMASDLCGQAAYRERGHDTHSRVAVMAPDMVRQLPSGYGLAIRAGLSPVLVKVAVAWRDKLYKKAKRQGLTDARAVQVQRVAEREEADDEALSPFGPPDELTEELEAILAEGTERAAERDDDGQADDDTEMPWS